MTWEDPADRAAIALLRELPALDVGAPRADRLRTSCHTRLQRHATATGEPAASVWVPATLAGASVLYAIAVVIRAIMLGAL